MNEASFRAFYGNLSDDELKDFTAVSREHAEHGKKMLAERAEAKRKAEEAARIRPGDMVTDGDLTGIVLTGSVNDILEEELPSLRPGHVRIAVKGIGIVRQVHTQYCRKVAA